MSKMDRQLNSKKDKDMIYEIYRACRLCGAGAGYKMPIIQNVVDLDDSDVELKQKVRDCVQIEVNKTNCFTTERFTHIYNLLDTNSAFPNNMFL